VVTVVNPQWAEHLNVHHRWKRTRIRS
jgi:hypothetical protein